MSSSKPTVRVVAALIPAPERPGAYFAQQRLPGKARPLLWEFPGGKVEEGETDKAALARECREELDVELKVGPQVWSAAHVYDDLVVELVLYRAQIVSGTAKALSAHRLEALTIEEMQRLPFCEADVPLLAALAAGKGAPGGGAFPK